MNKQLEDLLNQLPSRVEGYNWSLSKTLDGMYYLHYGTEFVEDATMIGVVNKALERWGDE